MTSRTIETTSRTIETTSRAIEMMSRVGADEGRGKAEGVYGRLETTGRFYTIGNRGKGVKSSHRERGSTLSTGH